MKKAQVMTEYILILGILLIAVLAFFTLAGNDTMLGLSKNNLENAVIALKESADSLAVMPLGSQDAVWITLPRGIQSVTVQDNMISYKMKDNDYYVNTLLPLSGTLPISSGQHRIKLVKLGSGIIEVSE